MVHYNLSFCNVTFYALTIGQNYYICAMSTNPVSTYNFLIWKDINYTYADPIKKLYLLFYITEINTKFHWTTNATPSRGWSTWIYISVQSFIHVFESKDMRIVKNYSDFGVSWMDSVVKGRLLVFFFRYAILSST
jgi:hypothetical protein